MGKTTLPSNIKSEKWNRNRNKLEFPIIHGEGKKVIPSNPMLVFQKIVAPPNCFTCDVLLPSIKLHVDCSYHSTTITFQRASIF
jgi:hypothetical protein